MREISAFLEPPKECRLVEMKHQDKRRGSIWHCKHSRKTLLGRSKKQPECKCAKVLNEMRAAIDAASQSDGGR